MSGICSTSEEQAIFARIERMPFSSWHLRMIAVVGCAHFCDAYDAVAIAYVLPLLVSIWHLSAVQVGLMISVGYFGQLVGALSGGALAERRGRISTLHVSIWTMSLLSLTCAFAPNYFALLALRFLQGIGLGAEPIAATTYVNEVCPSRFRGRIASSMAFVFGTGTLVAAISGVILVSKYGWQSMFVVGGAPVIMALVLRRLLPESPRWLAAKGRHRDAESALSRIEASMSKGRHGPLLALSEASLALSSAVPRPGKHASSDLRLLLRPNFVRYTISAWILTFMTSAVAYAILGWMPTIYRVVYHQSVETALRYGVVAGMTGIVGALISLLIIDRVGRRATIAIGFAGCSFLLAILGVYGVQLGPQHVVLVISVAYLALVLPISATYAYVPELYPTSIRALGVGAAASWQRLASIVTPLIVGALLTYGSVRVVYAMLSCSAAAGLLAILLFGTETRIAGDRDSSFRPLGADTSQDIVSS